MGENSLQTTSVDPNGLTTQHILSILEGLVTDKAHIRDNANQLLVEYEKSSTFALVLLVSIASFQALTFSTIPGHHLQLSTW